MSRRSRLFRHLVKKDETETAAALLTHHAAARVPMTDLKALRLARALHNPGKQWLPEETPKEAA